MKRPVVQFTLASLVTIALAACGQTTAPISDAQPSVVASQLLAQAMADTNARQYVAKHLERDATDPFADMTTEQLHSPAFYGVLAEALAAQGETRASVEAAFGALPNAYLVAPVNSETWNARTQAPLVAFVSEEEEVGNTLVARDSALASHTFAINEVPDQMVLVLYEGFAEEPTGLATQGNVPCVSASDNGKFVTRSPFIMVDEQGKEQRGVAKREATPGWVMTDAVISVDRKGNAGASMSLVNAGSQFILFSELQRVRDSKLDAAGKYTKKQAEVKAAINSTYTQFVKYTTEKVTEQTLAVEWHVDTRILLFGSKVKVTATITEMCNNENAINVPKTSAEFDAVMARAAGGSVPASTGKLSFSISPSNVTANLTVKGNGKTYSATRSTVLNLAPGSYTVSGYGYEGSNDYTMSNTTVSITAGGSKTLSVYMRRDTTGPCLTNPRVTNSKAIGPNVIPPCPQ